MGDNMTGVTEDNNAAMAIRGNCHPDCVKCEYWTCFVGEKFWNCHNDMEYADKIKFCRQEGLKKWIDD